MREGEKKALKIEGDGHRYGRKEISPPPKKLSCVERGKGRKMGGGRSNKERIYSYFRKKRGREPTCEETP